MSTSSPKHMTRFTTTTTTTTTTLSFLTLPAELRNQIYTYIFPQSTLSKLTIRSLFIRTHYRNIYMTQQPKNLMQSLPLLRVCQQITKECLPILYAGPVWKCSARIEELGSQIGFANFARIRRMEVGFEDLSMVLLSLHTGAAKSNLTFEGLEVLTTEGYQASALVGEDGAASVSSGLRRARLEAVRLCDLAKRILSLHPVLNVLLQQEGGDFGGSDAMDMSMGRVKWSFVKSTAVPKENETAVDLQHIIDMLMEMLEVSDGKLTSSLPVWMENGRYRQYPYLPE